jgi:hypothetical protein
MLQAFPLFPHDVAFATLAPWLAAMDAFQYVMPSQPHTGLRFGDSI